MTAPDEDYRITEGVFMLDETELAVRMLEAVLHIRRPDGYSAEQAFDALDQLTASAFSRAANAAVMYFTEQLNASEVTPIHPPPRGLQ